MLRFEQQQLFDPDPLIDKESAARRLGVELRFITRRVAEKRISYVKVGAQDPLSAIGYRGQHRGQTVRATV